MCGREAGAENDPGSRLASSDHTANLSGLVLGCIEPEFANKYANFASGKRWGATHHALAHDDEVVRLWEELLLVRHEYPRPAWERNDPISRLAIPNRLSAGELATCLSVLPDSFGKSTYLRQLSGVLRKSDKIM